MEDERKKLSSLSGVSVRVMAKDGRGGRYIHFTSVGGTKTYFMVRVDDIFDADGNRFEDDLS